MNLKYLNKYLNGNNFRFSVKRNIHGVYSVKLPTDVEKRKSRYYVESYIKSIKNDNVRLYSKLQDIIQPIKSYITLFTVYGSQCDLSFTNFSDVDSVMIIKKIATENNNILKIVRNFILKIIKEYMKIDPLQHHGIYIVSETFLKGYPEWFLPSKVLENSCAVYPEEIEIEFDSIFSVTMEKRKLILLLDSIYNNVKDGVYLKNMYELKRFLSQFFLLPVVYYQSKGIYYHKKDSFPLFIREFSNYKKVFEKTSELRMDWPVVTSRWFDRMLLFTKNPWLVSYIMRKMDWRIPYNIRAFIQESGIIHGVLELIKTLRNEII